MSVRLCFISQAREAVETRAQTEQKMAQKEKERKEDHLRQLAQKAREERAGIRKVDGEDYVVFNDHISFSRNIFICDVFYIT